MASQESSNTLQSTPVGDEITETNVQEVSPSNEEVQFHRSTQPLDGTHIRAVKKRITNVVIAKGPEVTTQHMLQAVLVGGESLPSPIFLAPRDFVGATFRPAGVEFLDHVVSVVEHLSPAVISPKYSDAFTFPTGEANILGQAHDTIRLALIERILPIVEAEYSSRSATLDFWLGGIAFPEAHKSLADMFDANNTLHNLETMASMNLKFQGLFGKKHGIQSIYDIYKAPSDAAQELISKLGQRSTQLPALFLEFGNLWAGVRDQFNLEAGDMSRIVMSLIDEVTLGSRLTFSKPHLVSKDSSAALLNKIAARLNKLGDVGSLFSYAQWITFVRRADDQHRSYTIATSVGDQVEILQNILSESDFAAFAMSLRLQLQRSGSIKAMTPLEYLSLMRTSGLIEASNLVHVETVYEMIPVEISLADYNVFAGSTDEVYTISDAAGDRYYKKIRLPRGQRTLPLVDMPENFVGRWHPLQLVDESSVCGIGMNSTTSFAEVATAFLGFLSDVTGKRGSVSKFLTLFEAEMRKSLGLQMSLESADTVNALFAVSRVLSGDAPVLVDTLDLQDLELIPGATFFKAQYELVRMEVFANMPFLLGRSNQTYIKPSDFLSPLEKPTVLPLLQHCAAVMSFASELGHRLIERMVSFLSDQSLLYSEPPHVVAGLRVALQIAVGAIISERIERKIEAPLFAFDKNASLAAFGVSQLIDDVLTGTSKLSAVMSVLFAKEKDAAIAYLTESRQQLANGKEAMTDKFLVSQADSSPVTYATHEISRTYFSSLTSSLRVDNEVLLDSSNRAELALSGITITLQTVGPVYSSNADRSAMESLIRSLRLPELFDKSADTLLSDAQNVKVVEVLDPGSSAITIDAFRMVPHMPILRNSVKLRKYNLHDYVLRIFYDVVEVTSVKQLDDIIRANELTGYSKVKDVLGISRATLQYLAAASIQETPDHLWTYDQLLRENALTRVLDSVGATSAFKTAIPAFKVQNVNTGLAGSLRTLLTMSLSSELTLSSKPLSLLMALNYHLNRQFSDLSSDLGQIVQMELERAYSAAKRLDGSQVNLQRLRAAIDAVLAVMSAPIDADVRAEQSELSFARLKKSHNLSELISAASTLAPNYPANEVAEIEGVYRLLPNARERLRASIMDSLVMPTTEIAMTLYVPKSQEGRLIRATRSSRKSYALVTDDLGIDRFGHAALRVERAPLLLTTTYTIGGAVDVIAGEVQTRVIEASLLDKITKLEETARQSASDAEQILLKLNRIFPMKNE